MCKDTDTDLEWLNPNETASGTLFLMQTTDFCCARNCGYHVNETRRASPWPGTLLGVRQQVSLCHALPT